MQELTKSLKYESLTPSRDLNLEPPGHEVGVLACRPVDLLRYCGVCGGMKLSS